MRKKSWLRQASRDRRPRRTQSSMSPNYGDGGRHEGSEQKEGRARTTEGKTDERIETSEEKSSRWKQGRKEERKRC